jgi:hypothetical protein
VLFVRRLGSERSSPLARILVVEDDVVVSRAISRVMSRLALEVIAAPSCLAARALACRFEVGLFELELIDGSGIELAKSMLDGGQLDFALFYTAELGTGLLGQARRVGPVVRKSEGVEALVPVVLGSLDPVGVRASGIRPTTGDGAVTGDAAGRAAGKTG